MRISKRKAQHVTALANQHGVIAATAMDQRDSLRKSLASAKGVGKDDVPDEALVEFKSAVARVLSPHASAILLDPEYGLPAAEARADTAGLLLAYELSGYDNDRPGRLPDLVPGVSARRIVSWGANAVKLLLYYTPFEDPTINDIKHAVVERVGAECLAEDIPFFLELVTYGSGAKPEIVRRGVEEFSKPQYSVDVFKVEIPIDTTFTRIEALEALRASVDATSKPFIYLSGGVSNARFIEVLELAHEAGTGYSGVLCGRATWKDGIPVYAQHGVNALEDWLASQGAANIQAINKAIQNATPWFSRHTI